MKPQLPHCEHHEDRDPEAVVRDLLDDPETEEVYFAVSKDFFEVDDQDHYEATYAAYERAFESIASRLKESLGEPTFEGDCEDPEYPDDTRLPNYRIFVLVFSDNRVAIIAPE